MPPLTMIIVMPSAPRATMTVWIKMILKFPPVKRKGRTSELSEKRPSTRIRPKKGPRTFNARKRLEALSGADLFMAHSCPSGLILSNSGGDDAVLGPLAGGASFREHAAAHDADGVADAQKFGQIGADENNGFALRREFA